MNALTLSPGRRAVMKYLEDPSHHIVLIRYKTYELRPSGDPVRHNLVQPLLDAGLIWRHPYTLNYVPTDAGKKYLQNL